MAFRVLDHIPGDNDALETELLNALGSAVVATDPEGQIIFWNAAAERLYGWAAAEVVGRNIVQVTPADHTREQATEIMQMLARGGSWSGQFETRHKSGRVMCVDVTDTPVRDGFGRLKAIVGVSQLAAPRARIVSDYKTRGLRHYADEAITWLRGQRTTTWRDYVVGASLFICAFAAAMPLREYFGPSLPFLTYFPAVGVGAALCGFRAGLLLVLLSAAAGAYSLSSVPGATVPFLVAAAVTFSGSGAVLVALIEFSFEGRRRVSENQNRLKLVNRELGHRLKNLFAVVDAICRHTVMSNLTPAAMAAAISGRIRALSAAQSLISADVGSEVQLAELVSSVVASMAPERSRYGAVGENVSVPPEVATSLALVLNELATNALKYGGWAGASGRVDLSWAQHNGELVLEWHEAGFKADVPKVSGFGSTLIKRAVRDAKIQHDIGPDRVDCVIRIHV